MRKYISFFALLVATFAITSCELEGGSEPNPNRANQNLWNRVQYSLDSQYHYVAAVAHLNDTLRGVEDTNLFYQGCEIAKYEDTYTLYYSSQNCTYKIVTAGTLLSEGGEWAVYAKYGSYMGFKRMGKATGIVGDATKFVLELEDTEGVSVAYYDILKSEVAYSLNSSEGCLDVTYNSVEGYSTERHDSVPDYSIEFNLVEPMVLCDGIKQSGEVYIHYKDYVLHTERALKVKIANKFITFAPLN
jgi:hypothetical protein